MNERREIMQFIYFVLGLIVATSIYTSIIVFTSFDDRDASPELANLSLMSNIEEGGMEQRVIPLIAVSENGFFGETGRMIIQSIEGNSNVFIRTRPYIDPSVQYSANIALDAARDHTGKEDYERDFIIYHDISTSFLGGESAGAAKAIGMIAIIEDKKLIPGVIITGTISRNGMIGSVDEVPEKIRTAASAEYDKILIPEMQTRSSLLERLMINNNDVQDNSFEDIVADISEKYEIEVVPVKDLDEAAVHMLE